MRRARIAAFILAVVIIAGGAGLWLHSTAGPREIVWLTDYDQALDEARSKDKPVVLYLRTEWCTYCRQMDRTTLTDAAVVAEAGSEFVWLRLDAEKNERGASLRERFEVNDFPTFLLLDAEGEEIDRLKGYIPPERFALDLRTQVASPLSFGNLKRRVALEPDSVDAHYQLGRKLLERVRFGEAVEHLSRVLELDPSNESGKSDAGLFFLAQSLSRVGEQAASLDALAALEKRFPDSPHIADAAVLKAELLLLEGRTEEASATLQAFVAANPTHEYSQRIRQFLARKAPGGVPAASH